MSKARILSLHCDIAGCDESLQVHDRPTIRVVAHRAGWTTWARAGHPLDVCPSCDARLLALLNAASPVTMLATRSKRSA